MAKTRNNYWLAYGCIMVLLGLWYIYGELKLPPKPKLSLVENDYESEEDTQEEEEDNDTRGA